jgi:hypothetical protein
MSLKIGGLRTAWLLACCIMLADTPTGVSAQANDFVVTMGVSAESYSGNFSAVTLTVVDSTTRAAAAVGQFGTRGHRNFYLDDSKTLRLAFDGGVRQFAAMGFELRDYAPREWVSQLEVGYGQTFDGVGRLMLDGSYRGHAIEDRPPMPLFLQPGYNAFRGMGRFRFLPVGGASLDALLDLESANYSAPAQLSHLDLLDRRSSGFEVGLASGGEDWSIRLFSGLRWSHYERQQFGDDPFRRDRATNVGATWSINRMERDTKPLTASLSVEGTMNRSNSRRPEYNALSVTSQLFTPLPWWGLNASGRALLTWKNYIVETPFARLVPGEEADNASIIEAALSRELAKNLTAQLRFGWTRAETDIGNSYFERFGTTLLFNFRPGG